MDAKSLFFEELFLHFFGFFGVVLAETSKSFFRHSSAWFENYGALWFVTYWRLFVSIGGEAVVDLSQKFGPSNFFAVKKQLIIIEYRRFFSGQLVLYRRFQRSFCSGGPPMLSNHWKNKKWSVPLYSGSFFGLFRAESIAEQSRIIHAFRQVHQNCGNQGSSFDLFQFIFRCQEVRCGLESFELFAISFSRNFWSVVGLFQTSTN